VRRRALLAGLAVLLVAACSGERSNLDRDAAVTVRGTLEDVDGTPLAARPVRLGSGVSALEGGAGVLTVGLFCLSGECSGDFFDEQSGDDGAYAFELTGADAQSTFGEAVSFLLTASGPPAGAHPSGPAVSARFRIQTEALTLPPLRLIDPALTVEAEGPRVAARWDAAAPAPFTVTYATTASEPAWEASATEPAVVLDGRVLEDVTGLATVSGSRTDAVDGSDLTISWRSSAVAFRGGFGAPPSRGAACELRSADGAVAELGACPLTDGSFRSPGIASTVCPPAASTPSTAPCPAAERVRVHLPTAVPADLLVVRGCTGPCRVAVVAPNGSASDIGPISGPFGTLALPGAPVQAVDVVTDDPTSLAEVSVWSPPAEAATGLRPVEADDVAAPATGGADGPDRRGPIAAAVVLLVGVAILLGRSRTSA
jgi:hypothetical protein